MNRRQYPEPKQPNHPPMMHRPKASRDPPRKDTPNHQAHEPHNHPKHNIPRHLWVYDKQRQEPANDIQSQSPDPQAHGLLHKAPRILKQPTPPMSHLQLNRSIQMPAFRAPHPQRIGNQVPTLRTRLQPILTLPLQCFHPRSYIQKEADAQQGRPRWVRSLGDRSQKQTIGLSKPAAETYTR